MKIAMYIDRQADTYDVIDEAMRSALRHVRHVVPEVIVGPTKTAYSWGERNGYKVRRAEFPLHKVGKKWAPTVQWHWACREPGVGLCVIAAAGDWFVETAERIALQKDLPVAKVYFSPEGSRLGFKWMWPELSRLDAQDYNAIWYAARSVAGDGEAVAAAKKHLPHLSNDVVYRTVLEIRYGRSHR